MAINPSEGCRETRAVLRQGMPRSCREKLTEEAGGSGLVRRPFEKRRKAKRIVKMEEKTGIETAAAGSVEFPVDCLTEEEINAGVAQALGRKEQENYISIRNRILSIWRQNVDHWLSEEQVIESLRTPQTEIVKFAYNFLLGQGQINCGVSPGINDRVPEQVIRANAVIIGAGLAGLAAGRKLVSQGLKVLIIEGKKRPGGRVYTIRMKGEGQVAAVDLGGSIISSIHENPLGVLARELLLPFHKVRENCPLYQPDGKPVDAETHCRVERDFKALLGKVRELREMDGELAVQISLGTSLEIFKQVYGVAGRREENCLLNWHYANLENAYAATLSKLSVAFGEQNGSKELEGDRGFLFGGNYRLIQALTENVPILYGKTVSMIRYCSDGVQIVAGGQQFQADMALCTVPLGVLKNRSIRFDPELPQRKLDAIDRLGFGLLNKVAILFPYAFWGPEIDMFGHLCKGASNRGEFFLFYSYASVSGGPVLIALVAGEAAVKFETIHPSDSIHRVLHILRGIYGPRGIDVPDPIQTIVTKWGLDPHTLGACSHVAAGGSGDDYDILAESAGHRLFFAGEATHRQYPATMHGAFLSGLREAEHMSTCCPRVDK